MSELDRRDFLKALGGIAGAGATLRWDDVYGATQGFPEALPPHRALRVPGVHAYAEKSLTAGETMHFRVSSSVPYQLSVCRLGLDPDDAATDETLATLAPAPATEQPIHPGSYVHVPDGLPAQRPLSALTLECWVRPWKLGRRQAILTQWDEPKARGFALELNPEGGVLFSLGDGGAVRLGDPAVAEAARGKLEARQWQHIAATWDGEQASLFLGGRLVGQWRVPGPLAAGTAPLRLGAIGVEGPSGGEAVADRFLDADLASPAVYTRALSAEEVERRVAQGRSSSSQTGAGARSALRSQGMAAFWPLDEERGDVIADASGQGRKGRIVNRGTWMVGGPGFDATSVPRFGSYSPDDDPDRGHALRLASDDLYDCRWGVTHEFVVPKTAKSGLHVGRLRFDIDGKPLSYDVTFNVKRPATRPPAPVLVLLSSNTWLAYSATAFAVNEARGQWWSTNGRESSHPEAPAYSFYRDHHGGQPTYQLGFEMPWPVAAPDVHYSPTDVGYSHLMRGERFLHVWLEKEGYDYDVVTDRDLHRNPDMLRDYKVLCINGHSEYWSVEAYDGVDRFLTNGGQAVVLSGNTMFWRVSFDDDDSVLECRKLPPEVGGSKAASVGEIYHATDKKRGGLLRECGYPAWKCIGLECIGWWGTKQTDRYGVYSVEQPDHFLFQGPEPLQLASGETFGHAVDGGLPRAGGHEADVRLETLRKVSKEAPDGTTFPEEPDGMVTLARITKPKSGALGYFARWGENPDNVVAEMIYWDRPQGGKVFHAGTIASGWTLSGDPKLRALLRNVLTHFGLERRKK